MKVDGPRGLKWTVLTTQSGRSRVKVDGPKRLKVDGPEIRKWTVQRTKTGRSFEYKPDGPKGPNWTVLKVDGRNWVRASALRARVHFGLGCT